MFEFDFAAYVASFRYRRWKIDRVGARIGQVFALHFVFGLERNKQLAKVRSRLNRVRSRWILRLREFASRELWLPVKDQHISPASEFFNLKRFTNAFRRCMFCRPTCVHFYSRSGDGVKIRPCWRSNICPFCWANLSSAQYVYVKRVLNRLLKTHRVVCTVRILREFVPAVEFEFAATPAMVPMNTKALRAVVSKHQDAYRRLAASKKLRRQTVGSLWRVVVVPAADGWFVETRQLLLARPNTPLPFVKLRSAAVTYLRATKVRSAPEDLRDEFFHVFGEFCRYPETLLTGYVELAAVYLHAVRGLRLSGGSGVLRQTGRVLMHFMRSLAARGSSEEANSAEVGAER